MTYRNKKHVEQPNPATDAQDRHEVMSGQSLPLLLTAWEPNQPLTIRLKEFLRVTGLGRSTAFEMWNPRSRLYDETMPVGFKLFDSPNAPRFFFFHEVVAWLMYRAEQSRSQRTPEKGVLEA